MLRCRVIVSRSVVDLVARIATNRRYGMGFAFAYDRFDDRFEIAHAIDRRQPALLVMRTDRMNAPAGVREILADNQDRIATKRAQ